MVHGELGENLPVESNVGLFESRDESGVGSAHFFEEGVHADLPESTEVTLLVASVGEGIRAGVKNGLGGLTLLGRATETIALNLSKDILSGFEGVNAFLYSGHGGLFDIYQEAGPLFHGHMELGRLVFGSLGTPSFLGIEVVLAGFAGQKLPVFGDFDALAIRLIGFHRHIGCRGTYYGFEAVL